MKVRVLVKRHQKNTKKSKATLRHGGALKHYLSKACSYLQAHVQG
jgi:hypothetical protein